jgi:hypothetical protein
LHEFSACTFGAHGVEESAVSADRAAEDFLAQTAAVNSKANRWRAWLSIFFVALVLRAAWGSARWLGAGQAGGLEFPDEEQYWGIARSLWGAEGLRDELGFRATRMPLYPAMLAPFTELVNGVAYARVLHWLIGALAAALALAVGSKVHPYVGIIAGLLVAVDPFLVFFSSLLLTETAFIAALLGLWWAVSCIVDLSSMGPRSNPLPDRETRAVVRLRSWAAVGILGAVCVYLRESSAGLVLLVVAAAVVSRRFAMEALAGAGLACAILVLALVPWAARNRVVTGDWCWLTHRGGISLYDGVGPQASGASDLGNVKGGEAVRGFGEVAWDRYFRREAIAAMRRDPARVARLGLIKLGRTWNPFPNVETYQSGRARLISAAWTLPVYLLAVGGLFALSIQWGGGGIRTAVFLLLPALYFSALHSVFVGSVRYRLPAMPMLEVLAAAGLVAACHPWTTRRGDGMAGKA